MTKTLGSHLNVESENQNQTTRVESGVQNEGAKQIKKYKSPVIKWVSHVDVVQY